jgi:hypothetical protein
MLASTYTNTRIGYEIKKMTQGIFSLLEDLHTHYLVSNTRPLHTREVLEYLRALKPFMSFDSFEELVLNYKRVCHNSDYLLNSIAAMDNPYFYAKRIRQLLGDLNRWITINNPPCSDISPLSKLYLEKCV